MRCSLVRSTMVVGLALLGVVARADTFAEPRAQFQQAWSQVASGTGPLPADAGNADSAALRAYVLYPYLQAARLERALRAAGNAVPAALDARIAGFMREHESEPVSQGLRRSWLASLAARSRWEDFLSFHRDATDGAALRCHAFSARIALARTEELAAPVSQAWLTPRSVPECERAFEWLAGTGALSEELIERRVRLALEAGNGSFARQIAGRLAAPRAAPLLRWAALLENPRREIDALIAAPGTPVETAALLAGWTKLARADRAAAKQRFAKLRSALKLDRAAASPFALAVALPLSWDRDADALDYFERVEQKDFDETAREWYIRAALWAGRWKLAARQIDALPETARRSARWRYWRARVAEKDDDEATARAGYESVLADDNYYSGMAAARLARPIAPNPQALALDRAQVAAIENQLPFVRARELLLASLTDAARAEWRFGQEALPAPTRAQAIHVAAKWGWYQQAVATATGERVFNDYALLYPRPYDAEVAAGALLSRLPPSWIYGVIRQESLYQSDAVSSANARGLMQMLLDTATRTARRFEQPAPTAVSLFDPAVNVVLGAAHLRELVDRFDGQWPMALAGYNAGPNAAQRWRPQREMDPDIWIENIPFNETRNYVQRIHWHTLVFGWLETREPQDTRDWLRPIRP